MDFKKTMPCRAVFFFSIFSFGLVGQAWGWREPQIIQANNPSQNVALDKYQSSNGQDQNFGSDRILTKGIEGKISEKNPGSQTLGGLLTVSDRKYVDSTTKDSQPTDPQVISEDEVIEVEPTLPIPTLGEKIEWRPPTYAGQTEALGWSPEVFAVPKSMKERVQFWVDIYTKYTTHQGLIHDSQHMGLIYAQVDFSKIENNEALSEHQKRKEKKKLVDDQKKIISERINRLKICDDPSSLSAEDAALWAKFSAVSEDNKFDAALKRKRMRFQLGQSDRFLKGIFFSGRYLAQMEKVFKERGLPIELTRLPFVESSFNIEARSRVGASGIWQFMRYTGRRFMRINFSVDERNDPLKATEAAARLFKLNYDMLGKWPLAITGYNHGPAGVSRITKKFKTDKIEELVDERHGRFGFASANFYASFLAALEVEKNARKYFGDKVKWDQPIDSRELRLTKSINRKVLERWFDGDQKKAQTLNPHLSRAFWRGLTKLTNKDFVRVYTQRFEMATNDLKNSNLEKNNRSISSEFNYYLIGQGETLSDIALQIGVSVNLIKELNGIDNPRRIRAGQKIMIPNAK